MRRRSHILLVGALLLGVAAVSSLKRRGSNEPDKRESGPCCPFLILPDGSIAVCSTNPGTALEPPGAPSSTQAPRLPTLPTKK